MKLTLGAFIAQLRKEKGLTQKQLSEMLSVSDKTVSHWEREESSPDISLLPVIAEIFGITVDELLKGERKEYLPKEKNVGQTDGTKDTAYLYALQSAFNKFRTKNFISIGLSVIALLCGFIVQYFKTIYAGYLVYLTLTVVPVLLTAVFRSGFSSQLSSPYIVEVYHYNETKYEYVMEYMDCTLGDYILNTSPKPNKIERIKIVNQVLRAFQYIHTKGLLHRDISPSNILIKKYDDVNIIKIADFGLVKVPNSTLTSLYSTVKGAFNDPALDSEGYANYSIEDETFALTKIVLFIMTGSAMMRSDTDESLKSFFQKGVSSDKTNRYHSVDEMIIAFKNLK